MSRGGVIRETTASVKYSMLTRSNYNEWALLMRVNLQAQGLWHAAEPEEGEMIEYREDRLAFAAIVWFLCASKDAGVSLHQAHRAIGLGGYQIPLSWCAASVKIQHRAAAEGAFGDLL